MTQRALPERYTALLNGRVSAEDLAEVPPDVWFVFEESQHHHSIAHVKTHEVTFDGHVTLCEEWIRTRHLEGSEPRRERTRSCAERGTLSGPEVARMEQALVEPHVRAGGVYGDPPRFRGTPEHLLIHRIAWGAPAMGMVLRSPAGSPSVQDVVAEIGAVLADASLRP
jgi:hypothetical protein